MYDTIIQFNAYNNTFMPEQEDRKKNAMKRHGPAIWMLFWHFIIGFKAKPVLHRACDNCNGGQKKPNEWAKYDHIHLVMPEVGTTKPSKTRRWQHVKDLVESSGTNMSEVVKIKTLPGMLKYLTRPPRIEIGESADPYLNEEFKKAVEALQNEAVTEYPEQPSFIEELRTAKNEADVPNISKGGEDLLKIIEIIEKFQLRHTRELGILISWQSINKDIPMSERVELLNLYAKQNFTALAKKRHSSWSNWGRVH